MFASPVKLLIVAVIVMLLFGAGRISELGKGLGEGIKNFKKGLAGGDDSKDADDEDAEDDDDADVESSATARNAADSPKELPAKNTRRTKRQRTRDVSDA